jgi:hypothetical protein
VLLSGALVYGLIGLCFSVWYWRTDWERAQRARDLRIALDMRPQQRPLWCEVVALSVMRMLAWPMHLIIHDL